LVPGDSFVWTLLIFLWKINSEWEGY